MRGLLQKTAPMLLELNEKAATALRERDEHLSAREQAIEAREQVRCLAFVGDAFALYCLCAWLIKLMMVTSH